MKLKKIFLILILTSISYINCSTKKRRPSEEDVFDFFRLTPSPEPQYTSPNKKLQPAFEINTTDSSCAAEVTKYCPSSETICSPVLNSKFSNQLRLSTPVLSPIKKSFKAPEFFPGEPSTQTASSISNQINWRILMTKDQAERFLLKELCSYYYTKTSIPDDLKIKQDLLIQQIKEQDLLQTPELIARKIAFEEEKRLALIKTKEEYLASLKDFNEHGTAEKYFFK